MIEFFKTLKLNALQIFLLLTLILIVRFVLEVFSNPFLSFESSRHFIFEFVVFYLTCLWGISLLFYLLIKKDFLNALTKISIGLLLIWIAPTFDLLTQGVDKTEIAYVMGGPLFLLKNYFLLFYPSLNWGVSMGLFVETMIVFGLTFWLGFIFTKKFLKSFLFTIACYSFVFVLAVSPSFMGYVQGVDMDHHRLQVYSYDQIMKEFQNQLELFYQNGQNEIRGEMPQPPVMTPLNLMPLFLFILIILGLSTFKIFSNQLFMNELKVFPYSRLWHYLFLYFWSAKIFIFKAGLPSQEIFFYVINFICLFIAAVFLNHYFDNQFLGQSKQKALLYGALFFNFLGLAFVQHPFFQLLSVLMVSCAFLYETPPIRLKRYWMGSVFCLGLISMGAFLAPLVINKVNPFATPDGLWLILPLVISLLIPIKDLKDEQIDQKMGTKTLVHWWGVKKLRTVIAIGMTGFFLIGGILFRLPLVNLLGVGFTAGLLSILFLKQIVQDRHVLMIYPIILFLFF